MSTRDRKVWAPSPFGPLKVRRQQRPRRPERTTHVVAGSAAQAHTVTDIIVAPAPTYGKIPAEFTLDQTTRPTVWPTTVQNHAIAIPVYTLINAPYAEDRTTEHRLASLQSDLTRIVTSLKADVWEKFLQRAGVLKEFEDVPKGLREGFTLGLANYNLSSSYYPNNHAQDEDELAFIDEKYAEEIKLGRISIGYTEAEVETVVGNCRTAPLSVNETRPGKLRIITNHSFPKSIQSINPADLPQDEEGRFTIDPRLISPNAVVNTADFKCGWGTFPECFIRVAEAPVGTQVAVFDVEAAFRNVPLHPSVRKFLAVKIRDHIHLDLAGNFGASAMPGVWGHIADAMVKILLHAGIEALLKWVDDFVFFRYPTSKSPPYSYSYDAQIIWDLAEELGWPWSRPKFCDFATTFQYLGFLWDLITKFVYLPGTKQAKYKARIDSWLEKQRQSLSATESIIGVLNHICLILPEGRSHMASLYAFRAGFPASATPNSTHQVFTRLTDDVKWWRDQLSQSQIGMAVTTPPPARTDVSFYVDASTTWGIGLVLNGKWLAFQFQDGWRTNGRDIGWGEMVAIELAIRTLVSSDYSDTHITIYSDNQGVVGGLRAGYSRGIQQNHILREIVRLMQIHKLWITVEWVSTKTNPADDPSRGVFPARELLHPFPPMLPPHLRTFLHPSVAFHDTRL